MGILIGRSFHTDGQGLRKPKRFAENRIGRRGGGQHLGTCRSIGAVFVEPHSECFKLQCPQLAKRIDQLEHVARALAVGEFGVGHDFLGHRQRLALESFATQTGAQPCFEQALLISPGLLLQARPCGGCEIAIGLGTRDFAFIAMIDEERDGNISAQRRAETARWRKAIDLQPDRDVAGLQTAGEFGLRVGGRLLGTCGLQVGPLGVARRNDGGARRFRGRPGRDDAQLGRLRLHDEQGRQDEARANQVGVGGDAVGLGALQIKVDPGDVAGCDITGLQAPLRRVVGVAIERGKFALQTRFFLRAPQIDPGVGQRELLLAQRVGGAPSGGTQTLAGGLNPQIALVAALDRLVEASKPVDLLVEGPARTGAHRGAVLTHAGRQGRIGSLPGDLDVGLRRPDRLQRQPEIPVALGQPLLGDRPVQFGARLSGAVDRGLNLRRGLGRQQHGACDQKRQRNQPYANGRLHIKQCASQWCHHPWDQDREKHRGWRRSLSKPLQWRLPPTNRCHKLMKLLLAEDDPQIATAVLRALSRAGVQADWVTRGDDADEALKAAGFDLAVLDIGLPGRDGIEVLRRLRERGSDLPVLLLTARDDVRDRVLGLDAGADDYLVKPFDMVELEARIRALLRRGKPAAAASRVARFGRLSVHAGEAGVRLDDQTLELSPREAGVLSVLLRRAGRVISKSAVLQELAAADTSAMDLSDATVEVIVHRLRRKLESTGAEVHTVRGFGYLLRQRDA